MATLKVPSQTPPATADADQLQEAFEGDRDCLCMLGVCCTDTEQIMPLEPSQEESYLARRAVGMDRLGDYNYGKSLGSCSSLDILPQVRQPERRREGIYPVSRALETELEIIGDNRKVSLSFLDILVEVFYFIRNKIPYPRGVFWNWTFLILCVIAIFLDPLFLYIPVINDEKKCLRLDRKLGKLAIALRSFMDFFYLIYIYFQLRTDSPAGRQPSFELYHRGPANGKKYLCRFFLVDLLSILPLPQVIIFTPRNAMKLLHLFVIFQYMPRLIRIYPLFKKVKMTFYEIDDATFTKAAFNLLLYMLASQVFGALWYFFAIERETSCWKTACLNHAGCIHSPFYCHDNLGDYTFLRDLCPVKIPNTTLFNFGIYQDALQSGIVEVTDFPLKFLRTFLWGLQSLSSFGHNLQTSSYVWENVFVIWIILSGLVFFLYLLGNMMIYLQSKLVKSEEMRLKGREIEEWPDFKRLPEHLQRGIMRHRRLRCREIGGGDVESLLDNLPKGFQKSTKTALGLKPLMKVPIFGKMDRQFLVEVCNLLQLQLYTQEMVIVGKNEPFEGMHFVMRGELSSMATERGGICWFDADTIRKEDFFGEVLISWALDPSSSTNDLPISTRTIRALTDVEAFVLTADDMKLVASKLRYRLNMSQLWHAYRCYSDKCRTRAARFIQAAWRRYFEKKCEKSLSMERNRQDEWLRSGGISSSSGASHHTSKFALNSRLVNRCNGNKLKTETTPLTQKLEESLRAEENRFLDALCMASGNPGSLRAFICAIMFAIKSLRGIRLNRIRKARGKGIAAASVASQSK